MSDSEQRAALDRADRIGYLPALQSVVQSCSAPFWWHAPDATGNSRILHNGSVCFVDTGAKLIAVTANHVLEKYLSDKASHRDLAAQFGSSTVEPERYVIDRSSSLDLVTFEMPSVLVAATGARPHVPPAWPPSNQQSGDIVMFGGYPGSLRTEGETTADMSFQIITGVTKNVSPVNIGMEANFAKIHWPNHDSAKFNILVGGMSGGPVFKFHNSPIEHMLLAGFIYEYHQSYELLLARPASCIDKDGRIASAA